MLFGHCFSDPGSPKTKENQSTMRKTTTKYANIKISTPVLSACLSVRLQSIQHQHHSGPQVAAGDTISAKQYARMISVQRVYWNWFFEQEYPKPYYRLFEP